MSRFVRNMKGGNACVIAALCVCGGAEGQLSFQLESNQPLSLFTRFLLRPIAHYSHLPFPLPPTCLLCHLEVLCDLYSIISCSRAFMWL